jgi:hypothetical protein
MNRKKHLQAKANLQAKRLWEQAYRTGFVELDFTEHIEGASEAKRMHYFLRNFRSYHKQYVMKNPALLEQMNCCRISKVSPTIIQIARIKLSSKAIGIQTLMNAPVVVDKLDSITKKEHVLKNFVSRCVLVDNSLE